MARLSKDGYGQVELNNVAFRRDGRIEAQCALDTAAFGSNDVCENGMILRVNKAAHKIGFCDASAANQLYALNYSSEHMYDERKPGLKNFKLVSAAAGEDFYPRVGYLAAGDLWTTNCVDLGTYASVGAGTDGYATLASSAPAAGLVMQVIKKTTMPDGQDAFQLQVLKV